jgi:AcrR family transcriptional regulator
VRRDGLLGAALDGFLRNGFAGTSLDDIAQSAHVAKRTIYDQFGGKEGLFAACINRAARALIGEFPSSEHLVSDLRRDLTAIGCMVLAHVLKPQSLAIYRLVVGESARQPTLARLFYENGPARIVANVAGLLERSVNTDSNLPVLSERLARDFVGLVVLEPQQRAVLGLLEPMSPKEIEAHVASKVASFLASLPRSEP